MDNPTDKKILKFSLITPKQSEKSEEQPKVPFHTTSWRWLALLLMNLLLLGDYVVIDSPQALETQLEETLGLNTQQYSYLYSSWALPSIVIPFIGGYLTDYLGVRPTLVLSCIILSIGQFVYWLGADSTNFACMLIGRAIYALGSNPLNVAQIVIIYKWFNGREIALAMSISSTTSCIGRALNSFVIPKLYVIYGNISAPILFGFLICVFSTVICIIMVIWDKINDKREHDLDPEYPEEIENPEKISLKDVRYFKLAVWLLVLNFGLTDGYFFSFNAFSNDFYHIRYEFSNSSAGNIISINYIMGAISSVVFGLIIDKKGYRATIIFYNSLFGIIGFAYYMMFPTCPQCISTVIPQILFGLLIGINDAAVFPSLPLVLEEKYLGTGFGLFFVFQNLLIFVLPPISAFITDITSSVQDGFFWMLAFFLALAIFTSLESFALLIQDKKLGKVLDTFISSEEEDEILEEEDGEGIEEQEEDIKEEEDTNDNEKIDIKINNKETQISTLNELQ